MMMIGAATLARGLGMEISKPTLPHGIQQLHMVAPKTRPNGTPPGGNNNNVGNPAAKVQKRVSSMAVSKGNLKEERAKADSRIR